MRKKKSINIVSVILSFVITVSILLMFVFGVAKYTGLSIRGIIHTCEKTEYYRELYNEMLDEALYVGRPYGIEKQHIENIIDYSKFIGDTNKKILNDIVGKEYNPDLSYIDIKIMENVEKIEENLTPQQRESVKSYSAKYKWIYNRKIELAGIDHIATLINATNNYTLFVLPICLLVIIISVLVLFALRVEKIDALRYVVYSMIASGLIMVITGAAVITGKLGYKLNVSNYYLRKFYAYLFGHTSLIAVIIGVVLIAISLGLIYYIRKTIKKLSLL